MNFKQYLQNHKQSIDDEIISSLFSWQRDIDQKLPSLSSLAKLLLESNKGGKNLRGTLVCLGYDLFAKKYKKDIYKVAAAYEILHTSLLIHDDVIDKSKLRRGSATVYQQLGGDHYGISQAVCLGDVGFFLATKMLSETTFPDSVKVHCLSQFSQIVLDTIGGQMLDIKFANKFSAVSQKNVIKIAEMKTAQYTIIGPLLLGANLAGEIKYIVNLLHTLEKNWELHSRYRMITSMRLATRGNLAK